MCDIRLLYHYFLRDTILKKFADDFLDASAGTCMKLTGLQYEELLQLRIAVKEKYPAINVFILVEGAPKEDYEISATRLIEMRNSGTISLLALIPSTVQTSAEDSYGNTTFKQLDIEHIDDDIFSLLYKQIPANLQSYIDRTFNFLHPRLEQKIHYLLALSQDNWNAHTLGSNLYTLGLIPDAAIPGNIDEWMNRINFNRQCMEIMTDFSSSEAERVLRLPLRPDTLQPQIASFLQQSKALNIQSMAQELFDDEEAHIIDFSYWDIPRMSSRQILHLRVEELKSKNMQDDNGDKRVVIPLGKSETIRFRVRMTPGPKDYPDLQRLRITLISTDGMTELNDVKSINLRVKTDKSNNRDYRDVSVKISSSSFEQGTYFFRVMAENEAGTKLNTEEPFMSEELQQLWEHERMANADFTSFKLQHQGKTTNETEDLSISFTELDEDTGDDYVPEKKKMKLQTAMQAYFRYRMELLREGEELDYPETISSSWSSDSEGSVLKTFFLKFSQNHNYQIPISTKLYAIERQMLAHSDTLGSFTCRTYQNPTIAGFDAMDYSEFEVSHIGNLLNLRKNLFSMISQSSSFIQQDGTETNSGIFETWLDFCRPESIELLKQYVEEYQKNYKYLCNSIQKNSSNDGEQAQKLLLQLQDLDTVYVKCPAADGKEITVKLMPPLHPLRLAWFVNLYEHFSTWEYKTNEEPEVYCKFWTRELKSMFMGDIYPTNNPIIMAQSLSRYFQYTGELTFGWGIYTRGWDNHSVSSLLSNERQIRVFMAEQLNVPQNARVDTDVSKTLIKKYIDNYIKQHPYTEKLIINIFNPGDGAAFVNAIIDLENAATQRYRYEIRLCCDDDFIEPGEAFRDLMNRESTISEKAEAFSSVSGNRLFPKIRFSVNSISQFQDEPHKFMAHLSFLINPFTPRSALLKYDEERYSDTLNGIIIQPIVNLCTTDSEWKWDKYVYCSEDTTGKGYFHFTGNSLLNSIQKVTAKVMNPLSMGQLPGTSVILQLSDKLILSQVHDYSDWVITFDKSIGPELFDTTNPQNSGAPFLLDYVPSKELSGISAFLTTRPGLETYRFLHPCLRGYGLDNLTSENNLLLMLDDIRTVSGSLLLQAISTNNKAFEVLGISLTKRLLEKKGYLKDSFLIPIDLHKELFDISEQESKERADLLLVSLGSPEEQRCIHLSVIEIKCRVNLIDEQSLMDKVLKQINHSIEAFKAHFEIHTDGDRLDREIKNIELKNLFDFYIRRAERFGQLSDEAQRKFLRFCDTLSQGYHLKFDKLEIIYNLAAPKAHHKEKNEDFTRYTIGHQLIHEIMQTDGDLNTLRLEDTIRLNNVDHSYVPNSIENNIEEGEDVFKPDENEAETTEIMPESAVYPVEANSDRDTMMVMETPSNAEKFSIENSESKEQNHPQDIIAQKDSVSSEVSASPTTLTDVQEMNLPFDTMVGNDSTDIHQYGLLGIQKSNQHRIALDLSETSAISLFGVQGAGKSYTIGTIIEMVLKPFENINSLPRPLGGVIFHFSESMDYAPEFTSMKRPNDKDSEIRILLEKYNAKPSAVDDIVLLVPQAKVDERKAEYPNIPVLPIAFNSNELNIESWKFLLGALDNEAMYLKQINAIMRTMRKNITLSGIREKVKASNLLEKKQKTLAEQRLQFAEEYIEDNYHLGEVLRPGRLVIVDLRDEFIDKDDALGLFVVMLNIFANIQQYNGLSFNKCIVFDEAHKYMDNKDLTKNIVTAIREMRHKGVSVVIASQDPPSLPTEIIELCSILLMHKFNSPSWLKHIQKAITPTQNITPNEMASLSPGEAFLWASKSSDKQIQNKPVKIQTRPRVTKHGGETINATGNS